LELGWDIYLNFQKEFSYDFTALVPLQVYKMDEVKLNQFDKILIGGGTFRMEFLIQFKNLKAKIFSSYGMTETISHIAIQSLYPEYSSCYQCLDSVQIGLDSRSCLWIYSNRLNPDKIQTNDIVEIISESKFKWLGRFDNVINSGGVKLFPEILEKKYSSYSNSNFFFAGEEDKKLGTRLILIIEGDGDSRVPTEGDKVLFNKLSFTDFEIPKHIYFLKEFLFTETKKIQRNKTLDLLYKNF
jgi:O-succinylbenzoic acid--CoA ligase